MVQGERFHSAPAADWRVAAWGFECKGAGVGASQGPWSMARDSGSGVQGSGVRGEGSGVRGEGSGFRGEGSGFRVQGSGFRVQG